MIWCEYYPKIPKLHKYSLGAKIDSLFVDIIEHISEAAFLSREERSHAIRRASNKHAALTLLLMVLWELHALDTKKYSTLSDPLNEVGKMLGGWLGQLRKQNSPTRAEEK